MTQMRLEYLTESVVIDTFFLYLFLKKLTTPFDKTKAFELGIIDERGNVLRRRSTLKTTGEKNAFTMFDTLVNNLKKMLAKVPGGKSKLASYAAALFLLKEEKKLFESDAPTARNAAVFVQDCLESSEFVEWVDYMVKMQENVPVNTIGGGHVATFDPVLRIKKRRKRLKELR